MSSENAIELKPTIAFNYRDYPNYVMFGTYKTQPNSVEFMADGIQLTTVYPNVYPNDMESRFQYIIIIPFTEILELVYCSHPSLTAIFLKLTKESSLKLEVSLHLGKGSKDDCRYDVDSQDVIEHYIIIVFKNVFKDQFKEDLELSAIRANPKIICKQISAHFLGLVPKETPNTELITISDPKLTSNESANNEPIVNPSMDLNININVIISNAERIEFYYTPTDVMFGTFESHVKELVFNQNGIQFIDLAKNTTQTQMRFEFIIQFHEITKVLHCSQNATTILFLLITESCNQRIRHFVIVGDNSPNGFKFDINSSDKRENYIIIAFKDDLSQLFSQFLKSVSTYGGLNINLEEISFTSADHIIECVKTRAQLIKTELKVELMQSDIIKLCNDCNSLKRKCDQLETNHFKCGICSRVFVRLKSNVMVKMVITHCGHVFCKQCMYCPVHRQFRSSCPQCLRPFATIYQIPTENKPYFEFEI